MLKVYAGNNLSESYRLNHTSIGFFITFYMSELVRKVSNLDYQLTPDARLDALSSARVEDMAAIDLARSEILVERLRRVIGKLVDLPEFTGDQREKIKSIIPVITDSTDPATLVTVLDKRFLTISKHLLELVDTEDQLAFVIYHEIGHAKYHLTKNEKFNSAPQELHADCWAAKWLVETGYDWRAGETTLKTFQRVAPDNADTKRFIERIKEVHPETQNRIKAIRTFLGACELKDPSFSVKDVAQKQFSPELKVFASSLSFKTYFDALKEACNYDTLKPLGKGQVLIRVAYELIRLKDLPSSRQNALWQELNKVAYDSMQEQDRSKLTVLAHRFFDLCCKTPLRRSLPLGALHTLITGESSSWSSQSRSSRTVLPLGRLAEIDRSALALLNSKSVSEAIPLANSFLSLYKTHFNNCLHYDFQCFQFFAENSDTTSYNLPWNELVKHVDDHAPQELIEALSLTPAKYDRALWRRLSVENLEFLQSIQAIGSAPYQMGKHILHSHKGAVIYHNDSTYENASRILKGYIGLRKLTTSPELPLPSLPQDVRKRP